MNRLQQSKARRQSLQSTFGGPQIPLDPNERNTAVMIFRAKKHHMRVLQKRKSHVVISKYYQESDASDSDSSEYDSDSSS